MGAPRKESVPECARCIERPEGLRPNVPRGKPPDFDLDIPREFGALRPDNCRTILRLIAERLMLSHSFSIASLTFPGGPPPADPCPVDP